MEPKVLHFSEFEETKDLQKNGTKESKVLNDIKHLDQKIRALKLQDQEAKKASTPPSKRSRKKNRLRKASDIVPVTPAELFHGTLVTVHEAKQLVKNGKPTSKSISSISSPDPMPESTGEHEVTPKKEKTETTSTPRKTVYEKHYRKQELEEGIENGRIRLGVLRISKRNRSDGYIRMGDDEEDWFVPGMVNMNRALDGDLVYAVKMDGDQLEKELSRIENRKKLKSLENRKRQEKVAMSDLAPVDDELFGEDRILAKVVKIKTSTMWSVQHPGTFSIEKPGSETDNPPPVSESRILWFKPCDKRVPFIMVPTQKIPSEILKRWETFRESIYTVQMDRWSLDSLFPRGTFTGYLGQMGELHTESQALLVSNGIVWEEFSEAIIDSLDFSITENDYVGRRDLRRECIFSIDPPTARDLDDALSCTVLEDGNYEIGVHIADVSHFVKPETLLDEEAYNRATSVYLVQKVIPMLPRLLCEELCSLNPDVDRLSFSVFWKITPQGEIIGTPEFCKSVIRSCAKLWYDHAQAVIEGRDWGEVSELTISNGFTEEYVQNQIRTLYNLSKVLRKKRFDNGALSLQSIRLWFSLDDQGNPIETGMYQIKEANRLVEEVYWGNVVHASG
jgi:protein SSD1